MGKERRVYKVFGGKPWRKETNWKTEAQMVGWDQKGS
jgi:hypothetical protein